MRLKIHYNLLYALLLIFVSNAATVYSNEKNNYLVIKLDQFPQENSGNLSGFSGAVLEKGRSVENSEILPVSVKVYPLGKPLQVLKSYVPGNSDEVDDVSRFIADTTSRYVPEIFVGARNSISSAEYIDMLFMSVHYPVSDKFSFGVSVAGGIFDLIGEAGEPSISCAMTQVAFEGKYRVNPEISLYGAVILGSTYSVVTPGLLGRIEYANRGGVELKLTGNLWTPWADNTIGARNNGRSSGILAEATLPLGYRFRLDLDASVDWRYAAKSAFAAEQFEGTEFRGGGRLTWDFFRREYRQMPVAYLGPEYLSFERVASRVGLFASIQASTYTGRNSEESLIPVTEEMLDQRFGLSATYAFNAHFGASGQIYMGYDPVRKIDFGKLYGFDTRLVYIPTPRLRFYGEFALDSAVATGIAEGNTWYYGAGFNYKF